jgi:Kef-type K+ transport system membrane component KefB
VLRQGLERRITAIPRRRGAGAKRELTVLVAGAGITIAGLAEWIGVSAAVGALFAGLVFSRDPEAVKIDARFGGIHVLLVPFFFVGIGLELDPSAVGDALDLVMD